ncbi:MAG TPA: glycoside hydrolase family 2 TIM barrel-domain containing protein [Armatimonadota bacterium]|jgi:beta-galactosidase
MREQLITSITPHSPWRAMLLTALIGLMAGFLASAARAQDAPIPPGLEDLQVTDVNKEAAHAILMPYTTQRQALAGVRRESPWARDLNGPWKFNWVKTPQERPVDFYRPDFDVSAWKTIPVPSCWQTEGYGTPYYRNLGYIFKVDPPHVMSEPPRNYTAYVERNPVGSYRRDFEVPANWAGRRIFVTFDGVDSGFFLWINGEKVGYSTNSRNPAEFDITKYVKPGRNMVAVEVYRFCSGSYLEDQDMYRLSGIFRNVTLWSSPQVHVRDFYAKVDLDGQYKDGTLDVTAKVKNYGDEPAPERALNVTLYGTDGKPVAGAGGQITVPALKAGEETTLAMSLRVANPLKWTTETPNLYTTVLSLEDGGKGGEYLSTRTGFRKVEIKGPIFMINGVPVKLKGTNRHENWPDTGHYVTEERMVTDLKLIKAMNGNHVRTSHYSDDPRWYELCDEYGIYLVAESNLESHGYGRTSSEERFLKAYTDRQVRSVQSLKNYASIVMWSLGNESSNGDNFRKVMPLMRDIDPTRPIHYEGFGTGPNNPADVDSRMYPDPGDVERAGQDPERTKPFYMCEYVHTMNNSLGAIGDYNDLIDKYPALMGGAIWEWQDQALWNDRDKSRPPFLAYGGDWGDYPNDGLFIMKGVVFADRTPKPCYAEVKRAYQWVGFTATDPASGKIGIFNKYQFTNLRKFNITWNVIEDGVVIQRGKAAPLDVAPLSAGTLELDIKPIVPTPGAEYLLNVAFTLSKDEMWAKKGYVVAEDQFRLPAAARPEPTAPRGPAIQVARNDNAITLTGRDFSVSFATATGAISDLAYSGTEIVAGKAGPKLNVFRAPHNKDDMWAAMPSRGRGGATGSPGWFGYGLDALTIDVPPTIEVTPLTEGSAVRVAVTGLTSSGKASMAFDQQVVYTVLGDGTIVVNEKVTPKGPANLDQIVLPRIGVKLAVNKELNRVTYYGRGPDENYNDRDRGSYVGRYTSTVKEQLPPYVKPMECGNHEDVRWWALTAADGAGLMAIAPEAPLQVSSLPYDDDTLYQAKHTIDLGESSATTLCLSAATLGVGTAACGPATLPKYRVYATPVSFTYVLRPVPGGTKDLGEIARRALPVLSGE